MLTQSRETPGGTSAFSLDLADAYPGGQEVVTQVMRDGMRRTLEAIKSTAEQRS